jgi:hypothetical protein
MYLNNLKYNMPLDIGDANIFISIGKSEDRITPIRIDIASSLKCSRSYAYKYYHRFPTIHQYYSTTISGYICNGLSQ